MYPFTNLTVSVCRTMISEIGREQCPAVRAGLRTPAGTNSD